VDVPRGWTVEPNLGGKKITVTPPANDAKYYTASGTVKLLVSDDAARTTIKPLTLSCPAYTPPEKLDISFTQPSAFLWGAAKQVGFTTQGNATTVKVLDVPADWEVAVQHNKENHAGTFTVSAPNNDSAGEAIVLAADADGNTVMHTLELVCLSVPTTLCTQCGYNGSEWVDCYVTTNAYPFDNNATNTTVVWSGNGETYYSGASGSGSDKNGRVNTAAISSTGTSAVQLCKDLGTGWYLPAYEELYAMSSGAANSASNNRAGAGILTDDYHWSSTEYYNNGGRLGSWMSSTQVGAVCVTTDGTLAGGTKTNLRYVRCAWRP
jgi:hypothetical protein